MLSWRLWQTLAEPASRNPIFKFVRDQRKSQKKQHTKQSVALRLLVIIAIVMLVVGFIYVPQMLLYLFQIPILMIVFFVVSPLFVPLGVIFAGGYLVYQIIERIHKEKRQYTYELICASPDGALYANWSFATGLLHRNGWFQWMKAITLIVYRMARITVIVVTVIVFLLLLAGDKAIDFEEIHLLISFALIVGLYYTNIQQSMALSLTIGLYTSSLNISRRDASLIGLLTYFLSQLTPFLTALVVFVGIKSSIPQTQLTDIAIAITTLSSIYVVREIFIVVLWQGLKHRLNSSTDNTGDITPDTSLRPSIFTTT